MEVLIDCYFDKLFSSLERSSLVSRHKRRELVRYLSDVINSCATAEDLEREDICERIVLAALRYHNITMIDNGSVCLLGKFHNVLYVAAKLCYDWQLSSNEIVSRLLNDIFYCEKTFERIFVGAIFGVRVTHFLSGWKSDFEDRDENIKALIYFLDHASNARLEYSCECSDTKRRFIDVPIESCGQALPLKIAVQNASPDILLIMLRYGALNSDNVDLTPLEWLLRRLDELEIENDDDSVNKYPQHLLVCLKIMLRSVTSVVFKTPRHIAQHSGVINVALYEQYPNLVHDRLVPPERSGLVPPELRHLCRCKIRESLSCNWALPHGIRTLQIPQSLMNYLDLLAD